MDRSIDRYMENPSHGHGPQPLEKQHENPKSPLETTLVKPQELQKIMSIVRGDDPHGGSNDFKRWHFKATLGCRNRKYWRSKLGTQQQGQFTYSDGCIQQTIRKFEQACGRFPHALDEVVKETPLDLQPNVRIGLLVAGAAQEGRKMKPKRWQVTQNGGYNAHDMRLNRDIMERH